MITIKRVEKVVRVSIEGGPLFASYGFDFDCKDEHYAELLRIHFAQKLYTAIEEVRKYEYNQGYKDGIAKKGKRTWFWGNLNKML